MIHFSVLLLNDFYHNVEDGEGKRKSYANILNSTLKSLSPS